MFAEASSRVICNGIYYAWLCNIVHLRVPTKNIKKMLSPFSLPDFIVTSSNTNKIL